jgi:hypothetical protein
MLRRMADTTNIVDAAVRFLRTNPELLAYATAEAARNGLSVDALLCNTVARVRGDLECSTLEAIAQEQMIRRAARRQQRRSG